MQNEHRSRLDRINRESSETVLSTYQGGDGVFWTFRQDDPDPRKIVLHPRVVERLKTMGFYGPLRCGSFRLDRHLITALVERWRRETHTFHFPVGEATITLQDVAILWGLPIEGEPIICKDEKRTFGEWQARCNALLGINVQEVDIRGRSAILFSSLKNMLRNDIAIYDESPQEVVDQYARGCALLLLGTVMIPDHTRNAIPLVYLNFLENANTSGEYSWGSAVLATLYRELCMACHANGKIIDGALCLLQIWAWSRIIPIQPRNVYPMLQEGHILSVDGRNLGLPPYGARWIHYHSHTESAGNSIRVYRVIFDRLSDGQLIWEPYDEQAEEISSLGPRCLTQNWRSQCPLINIWIVELHYPNRVLRQFGMVQNIPSDVESRDQDLHNHTRQGRSGCDWTIKHQKWITYWRNRRPFMPCTPINNGNPVSNDYMQWYYGITRRLISPVEYTAVARGFQPAKTSTRDLLVGWFRKLKISKRQCNIDDRASVESHLELTENYITEVEPFIENPAYL